jgi:NADH-quinone oxidoreductase subunit J
VEQLNVTPETIQALIFYFLAATAVVSCGAVVFARSIVHSVYALFFALASMAGFYAMLGADFLAVTQVVVYVGGILVLLLFGILLTSQSHLLLTPASVRAHVLTSIVGAAVFLLLLFVVRHVSQLPVTVAAAPTPTVEPLGEHLLGPHLFLFEFASLTLLVALVGAAYLVRREDR